MRWNSQGSESGGPPVCARLLITGCPRSGTKYAATLLRAMGLDVRHEEMGREGISSWCMAVRSDRVPWGPPLNRCQFQLILHQIRNPVATIPSCSTLTDESWPFIYQNTPIRPDEPLLLRAAKLWYYWNRHAERLANWRYRLEALPQAFESFCQHVGVTADRRVLAKLSPNVNTRAFRGLAGACKWAFAKFNAEPPALMRNLFADRRVYASTCPFSWSELDRLDPEIHDKVRSLAESYGYTAAELDAAEPAVARITS